MDGKHDARVAMMTTIHRYQYLKTNQLAIFLLHVIGAHRVQQSRYANLLV
jgi:hypothetical protein